MSQLSNAIRSAGLVGTPAEVQTALNTTVESGRNSTPQTISGLAVGLEAQGIDVAVLISLRQHVRTLPIGGDTLEGMLLTGENAGVDFTRASIRAQIAINQGHPSTTEAQQAVLAGMLTLGIQTTPRWQKLGLPSLPSEEEITAAQAEIAAAQAIEDAYNETQQWIARANNEVMTPMLAEHKTITEIKAALAELQ